MLNLLKSWNSHRKQNLLSYRLLIYILFCSTVLAIISTAFQLFWDYRNDIETIEKEMQSIEAGYLDSMASSLWKLDEDQISIQLDGLMKLPDMAFASITEIVANKDGSVFSRGDRDAELPIFHTFELFFEDTLVGRLEVGATLDNVYARLYQKFLVILGSQAVKTFLVSICILVIVQLIVVRHLKTLSHFTQRLDLHNLDQHLTLDKDHYDGDQFDSIDQLATAINGMRDNIRNQLNAKKRAQDQLEELNEELEQRVQYRTATLKHTNDRLSSAIEELTQTRDRLVQSEKMAALGELVTGMAHEINTPVSNSLTSSDLIQELSDQLKIELKQDKINPQQVNEFSEDISKACDMISTHLTKASKLISSFKQIAVDRGNEQIQHINVQKNIDAALQLMNAEIEQSGCQITVNCNPSLTIVSYPSSFLEIYNNLITNSIQHGFEGRDTGKIQIDVEQQGEHLNICYQDNGKGIPEQIKHRIFNPFVTSKRSTGYTGLGTHLIFNLVTQVLGGEIHCKSERGAGTRFYISVPMQVKVIANLPDDEADDLW